MIVLFPKVPAKPDTRFWETVLRQISDTFRQVNSRRYAQDRLFLRSPDGTTYEVTVDNSGTLSTAVNDGKTLD